MVARSWAIGTASTVWASSSWKHWRASRSTPAGVVRSPTPTAITPGARRSTSPPSTCSRWAPCIRRRADEARVPAVDQLGELGLALAGRHRQGRDRDPVAHPDRGVAGEEQVGQRVDEEVVVGQHRGDQAEAAAHLVVADAGGEVGGQLGRRGVAEQPLEVAAHRVAELEVAERLADRVRTGVGLLERLGEQVGQVEDLDVALAQRRRRRRRARPGRGRPRGCRRRAACRCCGGSAASARARDGAASPCAAGRPRCRRRAARLASVMPRQPSRARARPG